MVRSRSSSHPIDNTQFQHSRKILQASNHRLSSRARTHGTRPRRWAAQLPASWHSPMKSRSSCDRACSGERDPKAPSISKPGLPPETSNLCRLPGRAGRTPIVLGANPPLPGRPADEHRSAYPDEAYRHQGGDVPGRSSPSDGPWLQLAQRVEPVPISLFRSREREPGPRREAAEFEAPRVHAPRCAHVPVSGGENPRVNGAQFVAPPH